VRKKRDGGNVTTSGETRLRQSDKEDRKRERETERERGI